MSRLTTAVLAVSSLLVSTPLGAQETSPSDRVSVTISPLHLLNPQLHVTGEVRLAPRVSTAAMLGGGNVTEEEQTYRIREVGGQVRYYVLGSFSHGMMLGADVGYVDVDGQPEGAMEMLVGTRAGGFLGYKLILKRGFTAEVQLGPVYVWGNAGNSGWQTLHGLRLGWSF